MEYACKICGFRSNNVNLLVRHTLKEHKYKCGECNKEQCMSFSTKEGLKDHINYVHRTWNKCGATFKKKSLLTNHQQQWHGNLSNNDFKQCRFCLYRFNVPLERGAVLRHLREKHPEELFPCYDCDLLGIKSNFMNKSDLLRHRSVYHREENKCNYCHAMFPNRQKLHTHIMERHMFYACFFCGNGFQTEPELYKHQIEHCLRSFSCTHCNNKFDSLRSCQKHELQAHGHFGISVEAVPTLRAQHKFVNKLKNLTKPWERDVDEIISNHPYYMDHVHKIIEKTQNNLSKRLDGRGRPLNVHEGTIYDSIVKHSNRRVRNEHIHLLDEVPFNQQVETILQKIYMENQTNLPYKLAMQFGFLLFNPKTGKYNYWYANEHLSNYTDTGQKTDILQQRSNIWEIRSMSDIQSCLNDIGNSDFFTMLRNAFEESSNIIIRATNVLIQIFPMAQNDIGRGTNQDEEEEDDEEEQEEQLTKNDDENNIYDDDDDDDEDDEPTDEKTLILKLIQVNIKKKSLYSSKNKQNKCFFDCLAVNELLNEKEMNITDLNDLTTSERIMEKSKELFDIYCDTHGLSDVTKSIFNGVHLKLTPILEHLFHYRIDVYSIGKHDNELVFDLIRGAKSNFVYNTKKSMTLLFYENHYYLILRKDQVFKRFRCLLCGNEFTKSGNLKRHLQNERCNFLKTKRIYAKGSVETSQLLLSKIKDTFNVPDNILSPLLYLESEEDDKLLHPTENDLYFTKKFATYDFESKLTKTTIAEIRQRNFISISNNVNQNLREEMLEMRNLENEVIDDYLDSEIVYDDDGNLISGLEFRQKYPDEDYVEENTPLSYVIAYNFGCESCEEYDFVTPGVRSDKCTVEDGQIAITRTNKDPWELISSFYKDLKDVSSIYRDINLHQTYDELIRYLKDLFYEKDLILNIDNEIDDIDNNDDIIFDDDDPMISNENDQNLENRIVYALNSIGGIK